MIVRLPLPTLVPSTSIDGVLGVRLARGQLEGPGDRGHRFHAGHYGQLAHQKIPYRSHIAQHRDHHSLRSVVVVRGQPVGSELVADIARFLFRRAYGHHDDHVAVLLLGACRRGFGSGNKKAEALPLLAPGTTRDPGPRLRERSCRVAIKVEEAFHVGARDSTGLKGRCQIESGDCGAPGGTRTHDLQVRNLALYPLSYGRATLSLHTEELAEREGFEPSRQVTPPGGLANRCTRPAMRPLQEPQRPGF